MTRRWLRLEPGRRENLAAAQLALGAGMLVGAAVFYLGRILISREELRPGRGLPAREEEGAAAPERRLPPRSERQG